MGRLIALTLLSMLLGTVGYVAAYPLDGTAETGINRLEGYRLGQEGKVRVRKLPDGARWSLEQVDLRLLSHPHLAIPEADPALNTRLAALLGDQAHRYSIALLDLTELGKPRYAVHRAGVNHNPGSVGKLMVALGFFQALADRFPDDVRSRQELLRDTQVSSDRMIVYDHHKVPFWIPEEGRMRYRRLQVGDRANLYTYLDWMMSASANAAASMLIRETMLLRHYKADYPPKDGDIHAFFRDTPPKIRSAQLRTALHLPVERNGLSSDKLRQGGFFTREGKRRVAGTTSLATAEELMRFLLLMEKGQLIDPFSSREIKRLLYQTQRRIRYASAPALKNAAVYFKSGSLYSCKPEPDFKCLKYHGNVKNLMNSVAIVEAPYDGGGLYYMVVLMSNVLRQNSAVAHQTLATRIHRMLEADHRKDVGTGAARTFTGRPSRPTPQSDR